jgi:hypothetical protein
MEIALNRIELIGESSADAILNLQERCSVGHVVNARQVCRHQLVDRLGAKGGWSNHELRHIRASRVTRKGAAEQQIRRYISVAVSRAFVGWQGGKLCCRCNGSGVCGVVAKGHIAQK